MSDKVIEIVKNKLDKNDVMQKIYTANYDRKSGYISMSKSKVLFVEEKGFFSKSYNILVDLPYEKISKISLENNQLVLTMTAGANYKFTSSDVQVSIIEKALNELVKPTSK